MFYDPTPEQVADSDAMLEHEVSYLWADAGTGKTVTAMEALRKGGFARAVIICPTNAVTMWCEELKKHLGYNVFPLRSTNQLFKKGGILSTDAIVMPFGIARNVLNKKETSKLLIHYQVGAKPLNHPDALSWEQRHKTALIIDESHNLKSKAAKQTLAIFGPSFDCDSHLCLAFGMNAVMQLTGTPVLRYYDDLWTQLRAGRRDIMRHHGVESYDQFIRTFCRQKPVQHGRGPKRMVVSGNKNSTSLNRLLSDCAIIRRSLDEVVANLPPVTHRIVDIDYKNVKQGDFAKMSQTQLLAELAKEDSEAATVRRQLGSAKVPSIVDYVKEYGQKPYLIGFWHKDVGAALFEELGSNHAIVGGATPAKRRDYIKDMFNAGEIDGIIGQMQAMNTSWNLQQKSSHVMIAEELPSPGLLHQFIARVYRRGQQNHTQVDHLLSNHSIDVALRNIRLTKAKDNERIGV